MCILTVVTHTQSYILTVATHTQSYLGCVVRNVLVSTVSASQRRRTHDLVHIMLVANCTRRLHTWHLLFLVTGTTVIAANF